MLHVPSYQTIDSIQNTNRRVDSVISVFDRNDSLLHVNGSQSDLFLGNGKHITRHGAYGPEQLNSQRLRGCLKFLQDQRRRKKLIAADFKLFEKLFGGGFLLRGIIREKEVGYGGFDVELHAF